MGDLGDALGTLGACDEALTGLRQEQVDIPARVLELELQIEKTQEALAAEKQRLEDAARERRELEAELQDTEELRGKYQTQSAQVKTNQEYTALLHEIEQAEARIGRIEESILNSMEQSESLESEVSEAESKQTAQLERLREQLAERRVRLEAVERERTERETQLEGLLGGFEQGIRSHYIRVARARSSGTARIQGRSCGACNRDIPFEVVNRVRAGEFQSCGACSRILLPEPE